MHDKYVAIKTISLELDAYEKLKRAKRSPRESFSNVVRRAKWDDAPLTAGEVLESLKSLVKAHPDALLDKDVLKEMAKRKRTVRRKTHWES